MGVLDFLFSGKSSTSSAQLPEIYPLAISKTDFIRADIEHTYAKILTDVIERTHGIPKSVQPSLWDNCLQNEANQGFVSLLAEAMTKKTDLFLVYVASTKVLRKATMEEQTQIRSDYKTSGGSKVGVFISFKNYRRTSMLEIYSAFEHCLLSSLNKILNLSRAIQIKIHELRASVSLKDSEVAAEQARNIAKALGEGDDVYTDKLDEIVTATPDTSGTEKSIRFLAAKRAWILSFPLAYIVGDLTDGMNASGEGDMREIERGLKQYFVSIIQPVMKALYGAEVEFRSEDFRQMTTALSVLKDFDLTSDEYLSRESKKQVVARVFDLDADEEQERLDSEEADREAEIEAERQAAQDRARLAPTRGRFDPEE